jgi:hypothetical protein
MVVTNTQQRNDKTVRLPKIFKNNQQPSKPMITELTPMFAAVGFSIIYLLLGGGFGGAILIFIIAKMLGK